MATEYEQQMLDKMVPSDEGLKQRVEEALMTILSYGGIDGGHHKMWTLNRIVCNLVGDEHYETFVHLYEYPEGEDPEKEENGRDYEWDEGIAP